MGSYLYFSDKEFGLPYNLGAQVLEFKKPSTKELVVLAYLVYIYFV